MPDVRRGVGQLAGLLLALAHGEGVGVTPPRLHPHHQTCPACGFPRWDGRSDHPFGGRRFSRGRCTGPLPKPTPVATDLAVLLPMEDAATATTPHHFRLLDAPDE